MDADPKDAAPEWAVELLQKIRANPHADFALPLIAATFEARLKVACDGFAEAARKLQAAEAQAGRLREEMTLWRTEGETAKERDFQKRRAEAAEARAKGLEIELQNAQGERDAYWDLHKVAAEWEARAEAAESRLRQAEEERDKWRAWHESEATARVEAEERAATLEREKEYAEGQAEQALDLLKPLRAQVARLEEALLRAVKDLRRAGYDVWAKDAERVAEGGAP